MTPPLAFLSHGCPGWPRLHFTTALLQGEGGTREKYVRMKRSKQEPSVIVTITRRNRVGADGACLTITIHHTGKMIQFLISTLRTRLWKLINKSTTGHYVKIEPKCKSAISFNLLMASGISTSGQLVFVNKSRCRRHGAAVCAVTVGATKGGGRHHKGSKIRCRGPLG
jgi:hypothetical protein